MFQKIKECLYNYVSVLEKAIETSDINEDEIRILEFFDMHLAEELIKDEYINHERVAKIIMAFCNDK